MRVILTAFFLTQTAVVVSAAPWKCAADGEEARDCGGPFKPKKCCAGLECQGTFCVPLGSGCPTELKTDCISFSETGGTCQALHYIVRVRDENGNPVNDAEVTAIPSPPTSGGSMYTRATTSSLSSSYTPGVDAQCNPDGDPYSGTTPAYCWQQTTVGQMYSGSVTDISLPGCPNTVFDASDPNNFADYQFTGTACV